MNRISVAVACTLIFFIGQSLAVSLKELKKYQTEIKKACFPEACENESQMVQPSADEIEKKIGVQGACRSGGTAMCSTKNDKQCKKSEFGEECEQPSECIVIVHGVGRDTCGVKSKGEKCYDGTKEIWWDDNMNAELPAGVSLVSGRECLYVVPLTEKGKSASAHFSCRHGSCKTNGNAIVFVHFGCFEGSCTADGMEIYLKGM